MSSEILIVDDSAFSRNLVARTLASEGYAVRVAENGHQALEMVRNGPMPSLILLDIQMPGLNGLEVCHQLKCEESTQSIPVIFMTATDDDDAQHSAFEVGAADYITKPMQARALLARVKTHLTLYQQRKLLQGQLHNVMEQAPVVFLFVDANDNIVNANSAAARKFGYDTIRALVGLPLQRLLAIDTKTQAIPPLLEPADVKVLCASTTEVQCTRRDGSTFTVEASLSYIGSARGTLLMVTLQDVSAQNAALTSMGDSRNLIRDLAAQNETAREQERKHIAREVHDGLGQVLSAMRLELSMMRMEYQRDQPELVERLLGVRGLVDRGIADVRNIAGHLRPAALDLGLHSALEWLKDEFVQRTGIVCHLEYSAPHLALSEARAVLVYRIVQESLTNITKYASATTVTISVSTSAPWVLLSVRDDGVGFDLHQAQKRRTYGMLGMHERAIVLHGNLSIHSALGEGCCVEVTFPIHPSDTGSEE